MTLMWVKRSKKLIKRLNKLIKRSKKLKLIDKDKIYLLLRSFLIKFEQI